MNQKFSEFIESDTTVNHLSINWTQFKYPLCYLCLAGAVVGSWSLYIGGGRFK